MLVGSRMISLLRSILSLDCARSARMRPSLLAKRTKKKTSVTNKTGEQTDES